VLRIQGNRAKTVRSTVSPVSIFELQDRELQAGQQEDIFPFAFIDPIGKVAMKGHMLIVDLKLGFLSLVWIPENDIILK
jgi:hypothetical protein